MILSSRLSFSQIPFFIFYFGLNILDELDKSNGHVSLLSHAASLFRRGRLVREGRRPYISH